MLFSCTFYIGTSIRKCKAMISSSIYFKSCCSRHIRKDIWVSSDHLTKIKNVFANTSATSTFEIYPGTNHGFAYPNRDAYVKSAAEKHWDELIKLFDRNLK